MTGPTGLIFAMRAKICYQWMAGTIGGGDIGSTETNPATLNDVSSVGTYTSATGMTTVQGEALGDSGTSGLRRDGVQH